MKTICNIRIYYIILFVIVIVNCTKQENKISEPPNPSQPILQINQGGHQALIRNIVFTRDGGYLVSAGEDKVIRVWNLATKRTARTLRGQISTGFEGKIYAMTLSPNERLLAVAGWMDSKCKEHCGDIRLYDFNSGKLTTLLKGHANVVTSLAFSPNGNFLVSGSGDKNAIIWDVSQQQPLHILRGNLNLIHAVAFTPDSKRVVTASGDKMRLWNVENGGLIATLKGHTNKISAIAISKDDKIASGSFDNTIRLWNGKNGQFIKILANQKTSIGSLSFSPNGNYLVSGVSEGIDNYCHVWSIPDGRKISVYKGHDNIVLATAISPDGRSVATAGGSNNEIHIWSLYSGTLQKRLRGKGTNILSVGFDNQNLVWGKTYYKSGWKVNNYGPLEYRMRLPNDKYSLGTPKKINKYFNSKPITKWRNWKISTKSDQVLKIYKQNRIYASIERNNTDGYIHRSYTFTPNGQIISGGGNGYLTAYDRDGNKIGNYLGHTGDVWAVAVSADGKLLASASDDQTIKLWNVQTRENLITLFHANNGEWVAWTPSGHYASSPNGDQMVGWQLNQGINKAATYVKTSQLHKSLYRPDIVDKTIRFRLVKKVSLPKIAGLPEFQIVSPKDNSQTNEQQLPLELSFAANPNHPVKTIEVYVNNSLVITRGKRVRPDSDNRKTLKIPLKPGQNRLEIVVTNKIGKTSKDLVVYLKYGQQIKGNLYLVAVGVSDYQDDSLDLRYADDDAKAFHKLLKTQQGKAYKKVESILLADGIKTPTAYEIKKALKLFKKANENDTVILFLSGHGINEDKDYYFLPSDAQQRQKSSMIKWQILQNTLENTQGQRILLVDTCHSEGAFNPRLVKDAADAKIVVISSTDSESVAAELPELKHGAFTYYLLQGLKREADYNKDKRIKIKELDAYLSNKLEDQKPVLHVPGGFKDFVFALL